MTAAGSARSHIRAGVVTHRSPGRTLCGAGLTIWDLTVSGAIVARRLEVLEAYVK